MIKIKYLGSHILVLIYLYLCILLYYNISELFSYWGFSYNISIWKATLVIPVIFLLQFMINKLQGNKMMSPVFTFWMYFIIIPSSVLFISQYSSFKLFLIHVIFISIGLFTTLIRDETKIKFIFLNRINFSRKTIYFLTLVMSIPFILFYSNSFNLSAFNPLKIYDVRVEAREINSKAGAFLGYLKSPLTRTLLPVVSIIGIKKRSKILTLTPIVIILFLYASTGALKSMLVTIPAVIAFISAKDYQNVSRRLKLFAFTIVSIPLIETLFLGTYFLTDLPARRLLFVPGLIEQAYISEYYNNYLYYSHSFLKMLFDNNDELITKLIGEKYFDRPEMNANIGIIVDGYINLGYLGVIIHSVLIFSMLRFLNSLKLPAYYFGLVFMYLYYMNTSLLSTLLLTHGLLFFIYFITILSKKWKNE